MINFTKELPQNTTVIQSEHTEQYSKSSNEQRHLETVYDIRGVICRRISDAVFALYIAIVKATRCKEILWLLNTKYLTQNNPLQNKVGT